MHGLTEVLVAAVIGMMFLVAALFVGYFAYRARRARERLAARPVPASAADPDPIEEFRRLAAETRASFDRARETALAMRATIERGVR